MSKEIVKRENTEMEKKMSYMAPAVDIYENEKEILVVADMPGVSKDSLSIKLENDQLILEGRRYTVTEGTPLNAELPECTYRRAFTLNQTVDVNKVEAELKNGVLTIHLPKPEAVQPRQIPIKTAE